MKTILLLSGRIIMSQHGEAAEAMALNAEQHPGAVVQVIDDAAFETMMASQHAASEKAAVLAEARAIRERIFAILAGMQAESLAMDDRTTARAIADAQVALRGITTLPAVVAAVTKAETRAAIMAAYADIALAAPESVRSAFRVLEQ